MDFSLNVLYIYSQKCNRSYKKWTSFIEECLKNMCILTHLQNKYLSLVFASLCVMHECAVSWTVLSIEVQISQSWLAGSNPVFFFYSLTVRCILYCSWVESFHMEEYKGHFVHFCLDYLLIWIVCCMPKIWKKNYTRVHTKEFLCAPV